MTTTRTLPRRLAGIVEQLELEQPRVVTMAELTRMAIQTGASTNQAEAAKLAYWLQHLGWLGSVRTRNVWEFNPGSRAGAYGSGDRFIEFRAQLAADPDWPGVLAMESAASVLGLAQHLPNREVVALPAGTARPKALSNWRRVSVDLPPQGRDVTDDLPHWNLDGLLAGVARKPSGYADLAGLGQWLPDAGGRLHASDIMACLDGAPTPAWQRAAYLARIAGAEGVANQLLQTRPPTNPAWFGPTRTAGASYDAAAKVLDADLAPYLDGGTGA